MTEAQVAPDPEIAVIGSLNLDITIRVPRHPAPGETVLGTEQFQNRGGKGANQATAAARLGRSVAMVGRVGSDAAGDYLLAGLRQDKVNPRFVVTDEETSTGQAFITLTPNGENAIVVSPGANGRVGPPDVAAAAEVLRGTKIVLMQLEVPVDAIVRAIDLTDALTILNPAPAQDLPVGLLERIDILVPNRSELALLTGNSEAKDVDEAARQARELSGPHAIVVTLGSEGSIVVQDGHTTHVPAPHIEPVDTTGAGDAFCGALADALARDESLLDAALWANHAGGAAATRAGAIPSLPTAPEVQHLMADRT